MLILRATQKTLTSLVKTADPGAPSDTALGDWYVNRVVVRRRPLLLLVSAKSRLLVLEPAQGVKHLPLRVQRFVGRRLAGLRVPSQCVFAEVAAMTPVYVQGTQDRSVLGQLVEFARVLPWYLPDGAFGDPDLRKAEEVLAQVPCVVAKQASDVISPEREARRLLIDRWA